MSGLLLVLLAAGSFVGTHLVLSHPLRRPLVGMVGESGFSGLYSVVAAATLGLTVLAYQKAPTTAPLWHVGDGLWAVSTALMLLASVLLLGSLVRNPAFPGAGGSAGSAKASGVYAVTRHPMMWSFAIWGACHILIYPIAKNLVLSGAIIALALFGAAMQDRKKAALDPQGWTTWQGRTSYLPFAAVAQGRATIGGFGAHALGGGLVVWLVATWAHIPIAGWRAGIWRWLS